ncbi:glycosyltransferase family 2 protein [Sphingomonas sp. S2-65]|uniref:glycosyltransferase family 2 protein n=1 Tax=Sphingomonas sp. S2-65 TaxID=2903960 RepID=UPI001F22483D|nr:glycosyltransferase family 2 protein [Sphingomonas sp. S2-65]UYY57056.1 glycosyltransferase family 2 protein [Sphingomonas sp. S2-65]
MTINLADILVVIPCLNEEAHLPSLLEQLLTDDGDFLLVVADGGSDDRSRSIVKEVASRDARVVLMDNPGRLQSCGVNRAVQQHGNGRTFLVRIDAHCAYPAGYVRGLVATARQVEAVSVVVPMVTMGVTCFQKACAAAQNSVLGTGGSAHRHLGSGRFVDHGHHALMRISAFRQVGGYDETMSHNEDAELDHRLSNLGAIWLEPKHAITYFPRRAPLGLWKQYLGYGGGRARTLWLHRMRPRLRQMLPLAVPVSILLAPGALWWPVLALPLLGWLSLSLAAGIVIGARTRSPCEMLAGVAAMIMHLAWGCGFLLEWARRGAAR